jgi:surface antigen
MIAAEPVPIAVSHARSFTLQGRPCEEFGQTLLVAGGHKHALGTVCRQSDGTWRRETRSQRRATKIA